MTINNIFLIGLMGVGKTSVGRQLARLLKTPFFDADKELEARTGVSIPWIFDQEGEAGFRKREQLIIDELTQLQGIILATGGGVVLSAENREYLKTRGKVIWLQASLGTLSARTARDKSRPLLQAPLLKGNSAQQKLAQLLEQREPLYRSLADLVIDTDVAGGTHKTAEMIAHWLSAQEHSE